MAQFRLSCSPFGECPKMQSANERAASEPQARQGAVRPGVASFAKTPKDKKTGSRAGPQVTPAPPWVQF